MTDFAAIGPMPDVMNDCASAVIARDEMGRVLCQLRDDIEGVSAPGRWCFFGGQVEEGESLSEAAVREFEEETGLRFGVEDFTPLAKMCSSSRADFVVHFFTLGPRVAPEQIRLGEGAGFAFMTERQVRALPFVSGYTPLFDKIFD